MSRKTRKLIWSAPLVAVLAVAGALAIFAALSPNEAEADHITLPGSPMNLTAEADGARAIKLDWDAPADNGGSAIIGYRIDYMSITAPKEWKQLVVDTGDAATEYTDDQNLKAETTRFYRVFAINSLGTGKVSDVADAETDEVGTPSMVRNFRSPTVAGPTQLNLSWQVPEKDGGGAITSYRIHMAGTEDAIPDSPTDADAPLIEAADLAGMTLDDGNANGYIIDTGSNATTFSVTGLRAQQTWHFEIYARNDEGNSEDASDGRVQTTAAGNVPAAPTAVTAVSGGYDDDGTNVGTPNTVRLYWYWPAHDGGADITQFRVEVKTSDGSWPSDTATATSARLTDLVTNKNAVADVTPTDVRTNQNAGGYEYVHESIDASFDGKRLSYRVFTETNTGMQRRSATSGDDSVKVNDDGYIGPATVTGRNSDDEDLGANSDTGKPGVLELLWDQPTGATNTGYRIDYAISPAGATEPRQWKQRERNTIFSDLPYEDEDLKPGTEYHYRVLAYPIGKGVGSAVFVGTPAGSGQPGMVTELEGTVVNAGRIDLMWKVPSDDGGSDIVEYHIHVTDQAETDIPSQATAPTADHGATPPTKPALREATNDEVVATGSDSTSYSLSGMWAESTWRVRVYAVNKSPFVAASDAGNAKSADPSNTLVLTTSAAENPDGPIGLVAETAIDSSFLSRNKRGVLLMWNQAGDPAGAEVIGYEARRSLNDADPTALTPTLTGDDFSTFDTDDREPKDDDILVYEVRTIAKTSVADAGNQIQSDWVEVRYPADTSHMEPPMVAAPTGFTVVTGSEGNTVLLEWTPGADATNHWVAGVRVNDDDTLDLANSFWQAPDSNSRAVLDMSDKAAGNYQFQVIAGLHDSAAGTTMWSAWVLTSEDYEHNP